MSNNRNQRRISIFALILSIVALGFCGFIIFQAVVLAPLFSKWLKQLAVYSLQPLAVGLWTETLIGVVLTILTPIFTFVFKFILERYQTKIQQAMNQVNAIISRPLDYIYRILQDFSENFTSSLNSQATKLTTVAGFFVEAFSDIAIIFVEQLNKISQGLFGKINKTMELIAGPKWYNEKGTIDPGLIEVSLAITAVIVALPGLTIGQNSGNNADFQFSIFRILIEYIPIAISIKFIDLYAKDRGSKSRHVLLSPIEDGPFFFLAWSILFGFLMIAAATLGLLNII